MLELSGVGGVMNWLLLVLFDSCLSVRIGESMSWIQYRKPHCVNTGFVFKSSDTFCSVVD